MAIAQIATMVQNTLTTPTVESPVQSTAFIPVGFGAPDL
jgi:hypothetical protein